jgi:hypothetical protein
MKIWKCVSSGKTILKTKQAAKSEVAFSKMAFNNGNEGYRLPRYYYCKDCSGYHLTSKP